MKYPKINTIWKRDEKGQIIEWDSCKEEFQNIKTWMATEKIDGMNIRIIYHNNIIRFEGRTDKAILPKTLLNYLKKIFTCESMKKTFPQIVDDTVILYGEGYGAKIQKGGELYRSDVGFILFDVLVNRWWLTREKIEEIAHSLKIMPVPIVMIGSVDEIIDYVMKKPFSIVAEKKKIAEGIVATSYPMVLFRNGTPLRWKLKVRDYD